MSDHNSWTPLDRFASNFDWRTRENHGIVLAWFTNFVVSGFTVMGVNPGKALFPGDCSIIDTFLNGHK